MNRVTGIGGIFFKTNDPEAWPSWDGVENQGKESRLSGERQMSRSGRPYCLVAFPERVRLLRSKPRAVHDQRSGGESRSAPGTTSAGRSDGARSD